MKKKQVKCTYLELDDGTWFMGEAVIGSDHQGITTYPGWMCTAVFERFLQYELELHLAEHSRCRPDVRQLCHYII